MATAIDQLADVATEAEARRPGRGRSTVHVEATDKRLKLSAAISTAMMFLGALGAVGVGLWSLKTHPNAAPPAVLPILQAGAAIFAVGLVWRIVTGIRIWWRYG